jgi:hypothetical protein
MKGYNESGAGIGSGVALWSMLDDSMGRVFPAKNISDFLSSSVHVLL